MEKISNLAKNTSYLTLALILQKIISFFYFALLARYLGPVGLGQYYFAISFTTIFAILIDLGFSNYLTREIAKEPERSRHFLGYVLGLKLPLGLLTLLIVFLSINISGADVLGRSLVYISCISMILDSFTTTFFAVARGRHNLKYESISSVIFQAIVLISGWLMLYYKLDLRYVMLALSLASVFNLLYSWFIVARRLHIKTVLLFSRQEVYRILAISWPFAVFAIFQRLYTYLDSVLLGFMAGSEAVGIYQVAFKIIFALQFLPLAFTASLYPALSYYWLHNQSQLKISFERAINYLMIIVMPIIFGAVILADQIVLIFKDGFTAAVLPLQISIIALFFMFLAYPVGAILNACDRQWVNTRNIIITTIVSVFLNLLLIPRYGVVGASFTVLATSIIMLALGWVQMKKIISYHSVKNISVFGKTLAASLVMTFFVLLMKPYVPLIIATLSGAVLYFIFLFIFKAFKRDDINSIVQSFKRS